MSTRKVIYQGHANHGGPGYHANHGGPGYHANHGGPGYHDHANHGGPGYQNKEKYVPKQDPSFSGHLNKKLGPAALLESLATLRHDAFHPTAGFSKEMNEQFATKANEETEEGEIRDS
jgi:hypothetical protein